MLKKAKEEWWGTEHPVYGPIEKGKEYDVAKEDADAKMWESSKVKKVKADDSQE